MRGTNGRERLVRSMVADGSTRITALGRDYFSHQSQIQYIVHVPVIICGTRSSGNPYTRRSNANTGEATHLPVSRLGLGDIYESPALTRQQAQARVRSRFLQDLQLRTRDGNQVLMELSGEVWKYDRDGDWLISSMQTRVDPTGAEDTQVLLRQPMAGLQSVAAHLPSPEHILDSAWVDHDYLCDPTARRIFAPQPARCV